MLGTTQGANQEPPEKKGGGPAATFKVPAVVSHPPGIAARPDYMSAAQLPSLELSDVSKGAANGQIGSPQQAVPPSPANNAPREPFPVVKPNDGAPAESLISMMAERDEAGKIQNVYFNKSSSTWFFRITFNNKHITFSVAGLGKLEHAVIRECLMAVLQDTTKTNTSQKVLTSISHDISMLQQHGPECPPEKLIFASALPLYHTFMSRADAWLAKLSKDRGQGQAAAAAARSSLAPVSALFMASSAAPQATPETTPDVEPPAPQRVSKAAVTEALQAALDAGALAGVRQGAAGCVVVVLLPNSSELELEAPVTSLVEAAVLRELLLIDAQLTTASQLSPGLQGALSADWTRWKQANSKRLSASSTGGDASTQPPDSAPVLTCQDCAPAFLTYSELHATWAPKLTAAGLDLSETKAKVSLKDDAELRGGSEAASMGLLATFAQLPLHLVEKYQPKAGSASSQGKSRLWQELRERDSDGGLRGVNSHQSSATSFSISIPGFNTTLSRVDKLENAVVSEILIQLTSSMPRNISVECAGMIFQDLEAIAAVMAEDINFENVQGLNFMDALPMYRLVLSRLSKWMEQIERRRTGGGGTGAGPGRKRRRIDATGNGDAGTTYNTRPSRHVERADSDPLDSAAADSDDDVDLPSRPESRAANRRADSKQGGLRRLAANQGGNGQRWNPDSSELPAFCQVSHVFSDPVGNAKDFEALVTVMRQCVGVACTSCGERRMWTGVYNRFRNKWVKGMQNKSQMPESIAIYSDIQDFQRQGQYYAIMDAIDSYLCE